MMKLELNEEPDTYGFLYGTITQDDKIWRINILPPEDKWRGQVRLAKYTPAPTNWTIFINGNLAAQRKTLRDAKEAALLACKSEGDE